MKILDKILPVEKNKQKWTAVAITVLISGLLTLFGIYGIGWNCSFRLYSYLHRCRFDNLVWIYKSNQPDASLACWASDIECFAYNAQNLCKRKDPYRMLTHSLLH